MPFNYASDIAALFATKVATDAAYQVGGTFNIPAGLLNGSVTSTVVNTAGTGYSTVTGVPVVGYSGGGGSGAAATANMKAVSGTGTGGTGYVVNDLLTLSNGVVLKVATVSTGAIATVTVQTPGVLTLGSQLVLAPTITSTSGIGTGGSVTVAYGVLNITQTAGGINYNSAPTVTLTSAGSPTQGTATANVSTESTGEVNILTLVEILRAYSTVVGSKAEAKLVADMLQHAAAEFGGYGTSSSVLGTRVQSALMHIYADGRRKHV